MAAASKKDYPWYDENLEVQGYNYFRSIRGVMRASGYLLAVYPLLSIIAIAFLINFFPGIGAVFAVYWFLLLYLIRKRYLIDRAEKDITSEFTEYVMHSPVGRSYWKGAALGMIIMVAPVVAEKITIARWYEAVSILLIIIALIYFFLFQFNWYSSEAKKGKSMDRPNITERLDRISSITSTPVIRPIIIKGSRFKTATSYCTGMFRRRIVITDYLVDNISEDETVAVLAHEMAHLKYRHVPHRSIVPAVAFLSVAILIVLTGFAYAGFINIPELDPMNSSYVNVVIALVLVPYVGLLLSSTLLARKQEFKADRFSAEYASASDLISALGRIRYLNFLPITSGLNGGLRQEIVQRIRRLQKYVDEDYCPEKHGA